MMLSGEGKNTFLKIFTQFKYFFQTSRIIEWPGLERILKLIDFHPPAMGWSAFL